MEPDPLQRDNPNTDQTAAGASDGAETPRLRTDSQETGKWEPPTVERSKTRSRLDTVQVIDKDAIADQVFGKIDSKTPKIGKYLVRGMLGVGGMGVVYRGFDPMIEREVAIKVLPNEVTQDSVALRRFLQEARAAGKVNHSNVATIYETGEQNGSYYLVMELLAGGSLASLLKRSKLTWRRATTLARDACLGLEAMHAEGLVHRDIKPGNLMLTAGGQLKVGDFGLVKSEQRLWKTTITKNGEILGTPEYMSPEQTMGQHVDSRTDIYSLGATYFALLVGKSPFTGSSKEIMAAHCSQEVPDPCALNENVPPACTHVIRKAMAKDPRDRYATIAEMREDLERILANPKKALNQFTGISGIWAVPVVNRTATGKRLWIALAAAAGAIVAITTLWLLWPE